MLEQEETEQQERLERAIDYWIKYRPIATDSEINRVSKKFGVHKNDVKKLIKALAELEGEK